MFTADSVTVLYFNLTRRQNRNRFIRWTIICRAAIQPLALSYWAYRLYRVRSANERRSTIDWRLDAFCLSNSHAHWRDRIDLFSNWPTGTRHCLVFIPYTKFFKFPLSTIIMLFTIVHPLVMHCCAVVYIRVHVSGYALCILVMSPNISVYTCWCDHLWCVIFANKCYVMLCYVNRNVPT